LGEGAAIAEELPSGLEGFQVQLLGSGEIIAMVVVVGGEVVASDGGAVAGGTVVGTGDIEGPDELGLTVVA
jgi:hypothetical protein